MLVNSTNKMEEEEARDIVFTQNRNMRAFRSVSCEEGRVTGSKSSTSPMMPSILLRRKLQRSIHSFTGNVPTPLKYVYYVTIIHKIQVLAVF